MLVPWPNANLLLGWHLNPDRVLVSAVPALGRARLVEIHRHHAQLLADLRRDPAYAVDSPKWDMWFIDEHDQRRRSCFDGAPHASGVLAAPPPPPVVQEEDQEAEETYIAALEEDIRRAIEESEFEELAKWSSL